jgi:hypothetical protein
MIPGTALSERATFSMGILIKQIPKLPEAVIVGTGVFAKTIARCSILANPVPVRPAVRSSHFDGTFLSPQCRDLQWDKFLIARHYD